MISWKGHIVHPPSAALEPSKGAYEAVGNQWSRHPATSSLPSRKFSEAGYASVIWHNQWTFFVVINLIVGFYMPIKGGFPIKGGMTIPNIRSLDPGTYVSVCSIWGFFVSFCFPLENWIPWCFFRLRIEIIHKFATATLMALSRWQVSSPRDALSYTLMVQLFHPFFWPVGERSLGLW